MRYLSSTVTIELNFDTHVSRMSRINLVMLLSLFWDCRPLTLCILGLALVVNWVLTIEFMSALRTCDLNLVLLQVFENLSGFWQRVCWVAYQVQNFSKFWGEMCSLTRCGLWTLQHHWTRSTLVQVVAWCLIEPSQCLSHCWCIIIYLVPIINQDQWIEWWHQECHSYILLCCSAYFGRGAHWFFYILVWNLVWKWVYIKEFSMALRS